MRTQDSTDFKRVRQQTTNALVVARQFVSTPEYLALFHGPGHQEKLRADLMMVSTKGVVVSPARILRDARAVLPVWGRNAPMRLSVGTGCSRRGWSFIFRGHPRGPTR